MEKIRIHKYLASCGIASRRASEKLIEDGLICINKKLARIGDKIDPDVDEVTIKGKLVKPHDNFVYIALNKPVGYISSCSPSQGASVLDLVKVKERIFPVGRLDIDSEGLVLLTNDGDLANKLTHPRYECEKEYEVTLHADVTDKELSVLEKGVLLDDEKTKPCKIKRIGSREVRMIISEGKNRQIRRMFSFVGKKVVKLKRIRIKSLLLGDLKLGSWKHVDKSQILNSKA